MATWKKLLQAGASPENQQDTLWVGGLRGARERAQLLLGCAVTVTNLVPVVGREGLLGGGAVSSRGCGAVREGAPPIPDARLAPAD